MEYLLCLDTFTLELLQTQLAHLRLLRCGGEGCVASHERINLGNDHSVLIAHHPRPTAQTGLGAPDVGTPDPFPVGRAAGVGAVGGLGAGGGIAATGRDEVGKVVEVAAAIDATEDVLERVGLFRASTTGLVDEAMAPLDLVVLAPLGTARLPLGVFRLEP